MPLMNPSLQRSPMADPYQPSLLRVLHGATALLVATGWITGLPLLGSFDGRWGRLPFTLDGVWIELHGRVGLVLALLLLLFVSYALTLGAGRLRRFANSQPLLAVSVPLHLIGAVRRGGWPHWPGQLLRYVRRGR
jgi:hypothetical protein